MSMAAHLSFEGKDGRHGVGVAAKFETERSLRVGTRPTDSDQSLFYSFMVNGPLMFLLPALAYRQNIAQTDVLHSEHILPISVAT
jgi:hypothetical protein